MVNNTNVSIKVNSEVNNTLIEELLASVARFDNAIHSQRVKEGMADAKKRRENDEMRKNSFKVRTQSQNEVALTTISILGTYHKLCRGQKIAMGMPRNKDKLISVYTKYEELKGKEIFSQISSLVFSNLLANSKVKSCVIQSKI